MKTGTLKAIGELIGVAAIAGSLIFVGLQMQQAQQIALNESGWNGQNAQVELRSVINDHADVWVRGNAGADLDDAEAEIYRSLITSMNSRAFQVWISRRRLGEEASPAIHDLSGFLFEHPAARVVWNERRNTLRRYREPHQIGPYVMNNFEKLIRADLEVLDALAADRE